MSQLFTVANVLFCLAIAGLVQIQKKLAEWILVKINWFAANVWPKKVWPDLVKSKLWTEVFVPAGPLGTGMIMALILEEYPYPEMFGSGDARLIFGLGCGLLSGFVWRVVKKNFGEYLKNLVSKVKPTDSAE